MLFTAIEFAAKAHAGQFRKGTAIPYIVHPLGVATILINHGCAEELVVAGLLHDTVEDTPVTLAEIAQCFGERVAHLVATVSEPDKAAPWEERKRHTIAVLRTAALDALLVACADKLDNLRALRDDYGRVGEAVWARFKRPRASQHWYYRSLAEVFAMRVAGEPSTTLFAQFQQEVHRVFGADYAKQCI
jgi:(p)ppGpp synthase/HD superfamily hydrolase